MGAAPRTCCPTHADNCRFGHAHLWAGPFLLDEGKPVDGQVWSHPGDVKCAQCGGNCTADRDDETKTGTQPDVAADEAQDSDLLDDVRPNAREVALAMVALYKGRPIRDVKDLDPSDLQDLLTDLIHLARAAQSLPGHEHLDILRSAEFIADDEDNDTHGVRHVLPAATLAAVPA